MELEEYIKSLIVGMAGGLIVILVTSPLTMIKELTGDLFFDSLLVILMMTIIIVMGWFFISKISYKISYKKDKEKVWFIGLLLFLIILINVIRLVLK